MTDFPLLIPSPGSANLHSPVQLPAFTFSQPLRLVYFETRPERLRFANVTTRRSNRNGPASLSFFPASLRFPLSYPPNAIDHSRTITQPNETKRNDLSSSSSSPNAPPSTRDFRHSFSPSLEIPGTKRNEGSVEYEEICCWNGESLETRFPFPLETTRRFARSKPLD